MACSMSVTMSAAGRAAAPAPVRNLSSVRARVTPALRAPLRAAKPAGRKSMKVQMGYYDEYERPDPSRYQWPNKEFIAETLEKFPEEGVASVDEGFVLFKEGGYIYLDIRSALNRDAIGPVTGATHIPWIIEKKRFEDGKMVIDVSENEDWLNQVKKLIPDQETPIMVADLDGRTHAIDALEYLFEEGYENVVGLKGGFKMWFRTFDNKFRRRVFGEYAENYMSGDRLGMGDSCGIHSSGAGFENQDRLSGEFWDNF